MKVAFSYRSTDPNFEISAFPTRHFRPTDRRAQRGEENLGVGPPDRPTLPEAGRGLRPESDNPTDRPSPRPGRVPTLSRSSIRLYRYVLPFSHIREDRPTDCRAQRATKKNRLDRSDRPTLSLLPRGCAPTRPFRPTDRRAQRGVRKTGSNHPTDRPSFRRS